MNYLVLKSNWRNHTVFFELLSSGKASVIICLAKVSQCPAMYPDCHAQEAVQGENKSVRTVLFQTILIFSATSLALLARGLLLESTLPRSWLNNEAKIWKIFAPVCCKRRGTEDCGKPLGSKDCGKLNHLSG